MKRSNIIKEYFYNNVNQFDLRANNKSDIKVCTYAVNKEEYGTINFFISDNAGFKYLLKKSRNEVADGRHRLRIAELNKILIDDKYDCLRPYMIIGQEVEIFGDRFLLYEFIKCSNFYRLIRSNLAGTNILALLDIAFEFCHLLEKSSTMTGLISDEVEKILETFSSAYADSKEMMLFGKVFREEIADISVNLGITIVHNDLVASNMLLNNSHYWVVDWEYWSKCLSIFNYFDIVINFGSLIEGGLFSKRRKRRYFYIFNEKISSRSIKFIKRCGQVAEKKMALCDVSLEVIERLFLLYMINKSVCQYRTFGSHYGFDYFWYDLLREFLEIRGRFKIFWERILDWKHL